LFSLVWRLQPCQVNGSLETGLCENAVYGVKWKKRLERGTTKNKIKTGLALSAALMTLFAAAAGADTPGDSMY